MFLFNTLCLNNFNSCGLTTTRGKLSSGVCVSVVFSRTFKGDGDEVVNQELIDKFGLDKVEARKILDKFALDEFEPAQEKVVKLVKQRSIVSVNLVKLHFLELFTQLVMGSILGHNIFYVKVAFKNGEFKMLGCQDTIKYEGVETIAEFRNGIKKQLSDLLKLYKIKPSIVDYLSIVFTPVDMNFINKFKLDIDNTPEYLRAGINQSFSVETTIPIVLKDKFLGKQLHKERFNGKITKVSFINTLGDVNKEISFSHQFDFTPKLRALSPNFKFYFVILNGIPRVLGVHILSPFTVRKMLFNMNGSVIEDVVDNISEVGIVTRKTDGYVTIFDGGKIVKVYKEVKLLPIKHKQVNIFHENPNIGVIDFETYKSKGSIYRVYACGFKTSLSEEVTTYYIDKTYNSYQLVLDFINELLRSKYSKINFYCHNLGDFDVVFLLRVLIHYNIHNTEN